MVVEKNGDFHPIKIESVKSVKTFTVAKKTLPEGKSSNLQGSRLKDVIRQKHLKLAVQKKTVQQRPFGEVFAAVAENETPPHVWVGQQKPKLKRVT